MSPCTRCGDALCNDERLLCRACTSEMKLESDARVSGRGKVAERCVRCLGALPNGHRVDICPKCFISKAPSLIPARYNADEWAEALGMREGDRPPMQNEEARYSVMTELLIPALALESEESRTFICSRFCIQYLPRLIDLVLDPPPPSLAKYTARHRLGNAYTVALSSVMDNSYCVRFFLSNHRSARKANSVAAYLVTEFARVAPEFDLNMQHNTAGQRDKQLQEQKSAEAFIFNTCNLLFCVLSVHIDKEAAVPIPTDAKAILLAYLDKWAPLLQARGRAQALEMAVGVLRGDPFWSTQARLARDGLENLVCCHKEGCGKMYDLMQCARCKTVLYCSRKHQEQDWACRRLPHKLVCFQTSY